MMRKTEMAVALVASLLAVSECHAKAGMDSGYTHDELKKMAREAHTWEQYEALAAYYRCLQQEFGERAQSEMSEWSRRGFFVMRPAAKYPRPIDASRNRYEYFKSRSRRMGELADRYEGFAAGAKR